MMQCPQERKILPNIIKNTNMNLALQCFFISSMDLYGTVLAYFEGRRIKVSAQTSRGLCRVTIGRTLLFASSSNIFDPYPRFTKIIIITLPDIFPYTPRRARDMISTGLTPLAPVPTVDKANEMILQDTLQISLAEHIHPGEQKQAKCGTWNDESNIPGTRIEPRSDKESLEVEIAKEKEVEISKEKEVELTNVVIHQVNKKDE
ncbi:hypothetical protein Tco_0223402 [Tanacetum coccineum]